MSTYAELVKRGLDYAKQVKSGVEATRAMNTDSADSSADPIATARAEQNQRIASANSLRTDKAATDGLRTDKRSKLPANGLHYIDALNLKTNGSSVDPMEAARAEQNARISANNR